MNKTEKIAVALMILFAFGMGAVGMWIGLTFKMPSSASNVYHVGDFVAGHWQFVGYMIGGGSCYPKEGANFDNRQTGDVVSFDVLTPNVTVTLGNRTYVCTSYYAPASWYGPDPSTITLKPTN
jgi:hypothetical protein